MKRAQKKTKGSEMMADRARHSSGQRVSEGHRRDESSATSGANRTQSSVSYEKENCRSITPAESERDVRPNGGLREAEGWIGCGGSAFRFSGRTRFSSHRLLRIFRKCGKDI
ncbi:hypothetical protein AAFF_G00187030 [Aldrovandia affinis]|uniref:Uncharacterized protein n=1 Tax=Aldrovandia affinis TaxID=143900 RepID=A0AAD7SXX3_9TELE|nr:hypothetical protein AAFF_G00187030 [Aldrovandia affinis]